MDLLLKGFHQLIEPFASWLDVVDVLLVALVFYNLLLLIRGTREAQILLGILVLVAVYYGAKILELRALETTLQNFFLVLPVALVVLFQHEIRRALAKFGSTPLWGFSDQRKVASTFNELVLASTTLSERKVGALIVIERLEGLRNYVENGILLDAVVSLDLLINLFTPTTPTHDGAVIIQGDRIAAAACFLPLTQNPELSTEFGTRHRAALGISEETDALVVVVSEESGSISVAFGGEIHRPLESKDLHNLLYKLLVTDVFAAEEATS
jgi:diadenylate cyclase